ncbi:hypothetical protein ABT282_07980 [Streptomyces sp. NPDC000927]|uniref:hypothetical protein n=1 Tax=Streptomyces sp. NPDC000927 TaxID=3154371 RepID=UPI00331CBD6E
MKYRLSFTPRADRGYRKLAAEGGQGKAKQLSKALGKLACDPRHSSLRTHRLKGIPRFGRDDLWISYIRTGPGGERVVWAFGEKADKIQVIDVEYIGPHID